MEKSDAEKKKAYSVYKKGELHKELENIPKVSTRQEPRDVYGYQKDYVFGRAYELGQINIAKRKAKSKKRTIQNHSTGDGRNVTTVTATQRTVYNAIRTIIENGGNTSYKALREAGVLKKTIFALVKAKLIEINDDDEGTIKLYIKLESGQEIMEKGGVGKIVINLPG